MTYKTYSYTSSGWTIGEDPDAPPDKRWCAVHPLWGEKYFKEHDKILEFTVSHMADQFARLFKDR